MPSRQGSLFAGADLEKLVIFWQAWLFSGKLYQSINSKDSIDNTSKQPIHDHSIRYMPDQQQQGTYYTIFYLILPPIYTKQHYYALPPSIRQAHRTYQPAIPSEAPCVNIIISMRMQSTECSLETSPSQTHFHTVNSIYQLQSIINRLSVDNEKHRIAQAEAVRAWEQAHSAVRLERQARVTAEVELEGLRVELEALRGGIERVRREKQDLEAVMACMPRRGSTVSLEMFLHEYDRMESKVEETGKSLVQMKAVLQQKVIENEGLREQIKRMSSLTNEQATSNKTKLENNQQYHARQLQDHRKQSQAIIAHLQNQLHHYKQLNHTNQEQLSLLSSQASQHHHKLHQLQLSLLLTQQPRSHSPAPRTPQLQYQQLLQQYNQVLVELQGRGRELAMQRALGEGYKREAENLEAILKLREQAGTRDQWQGKEQGQMEGQQAGKGQATDYLGKMRLMGIEHEMERKVWDREMEAMRERVKAMEEANKEQRANIRETRRKLTTKEQQAQSLRANNYKLLEQLQKARKQLAISNDSLMNIKQQLSRAQLLQVLKKQKTKAQTQPIQLNKYSQMHEIINKISAEKVGLMKQNIQLKSQLEQLSQEIIQRIKTTNQLQYEVNSLAITNQKLKEQNMALTSKCIELERRNFSNEGAMEQGRSKYQQQIRQLHEQLHRIQKDQRNQVLQCTQPHFQTKKTERQNQICTRQYDIEITPHNQDKVGPASPLLPTQNAGKQIVNPGEQLELKIHARLHGSQTRKRAHTERNHEATQQPVAKSKPKYYCTEELSKKIEELKKQRKLLNTSVV